MTNALYPQADESSVSLLDHLSAAIFITDEGSRLLWANAAAGGWLKTAQLFTVCDARVVPSSPLGDGILCVAEHLRSGQRFTQSCGEFSLHIERLRPDPADSFGYMRRAVLWRVTGSAIDGIVRRAYLRRRFGATPREAEVGDLVARGVRPAEIATKIGASPSTVRTHLKRLFAKTASHGQGKLAEILREPFLAERRD